MTATVNDWVGSWLAAGRYRVTAKLGEGGMGFVYQAWTDNPGRYVVIKVPRASMMDDPEFAPRFAEEVRSLVRLEHPHIVPVYEVGVHDGLPFAVMRYLSGGSLENRRPLDGAGQPLPLPPASLAEWLRIVAEALDFIHGQGYVHRDVKPANILFDAHGIAYLSDFGVAKALAASGESARAKSLTGTGMVLGTPHYMAPELIAGQSFDGRIDQYALAVTVHVLLSGRPPIDGPTDLAVLVQHTRQPPPSLDALVPSVSPELAAAVLRGLAKHPGERFPTCVEFARVALAAVNGAPLATAPPLRSPPGRSAISIATPIVPTGHIAETMATAGIGTDAQSVLSRVSKSRGFAQLAIAAIRANWLRRSPARWALLSGMLLAPALLALAFSSMDTKPLPPIPSGTPKKSVIAVVKPPLPDDVDLRRLIAKSQTLMDAFEKQLHPISAAIIGGGKYGSRAEFEELLDGASRARRSELRPDIDTIEVKFKELRDALNKFETTLNAADPNYAKESSAQDADQRTPTAHSPNEDNLERDKKLGELHDALTTHRAKKRDELDKKLSALKTALANLTYKDADAIKELHALAEIDEAVGHEARTEFDPYTLDRANHFFTRDKPEDPLYFRAFCALVRAADQRAIEKLKEKEIKSDFYTQSQRVELCRATFASGDPGALALGVRRLIQEQAPPSPLLADFGRDELLAQTEHAPHAWAQVVPLLLRQYDDRETAERLLPIQCMLKQKGSADALRRSSSDGALRDSGALVVVQIVHDNWTDAYAVVDDILLRDRELTFDSLSNDDLDRTLQAPRQTRIALARHVVRSGTWKQVEWAIDVFRYADEFSETELRERLEARQRDDVHTRVLGQLLSGNANDKTLNVVEWLLTQPKQIRADELNVAQIGDAVLDRKTLKGKLLACLGKAGPEARCWALNKALGANFGKRFADVQAMHRAQRKLIDLASGIRVPTDHDASFFGSTKEQLLRSEGAQTCQRHDWQTDAKELTGIVSNSGDETLPEKLRDSLLSFLELVMKEAKECQKLLATVSRGADLEKKVRGTKDNWKRWEGYKSDFQSDLKKCQELATEIEQLESRLPDIEENAVVPTTRVQPAPSGDKRKGRPE